MRRAWQCVVAGALAGAVSASGCAPDTGTSTAKVEVRPASASGFVDLGNGMIYDEVLDVTWLQDARYARTSGFDADGLMTWDEAKAWAAGLWIGGTDGWRLPSFDPANTRPQTPTAENEIGSLLGALTDGHFTWPQPPDTSPFVHVLDGIHDQFWTGLAGNTPGTAWDYHMTCG